MFFFTLVTISHNVIIYHEANRNDYTVKTDVITKKSHKYDWLTRLCHDVNSNQRYPNCQIMKILTKVLIIIKFAHLTGD